MPLAGTNSLSEFMATKYLGAADVRRLASQLGVTPTKKWGQNFVIDPNTIRHIVDEAHVTADDIVVEIGPGLGSLTLGLLDKAKQVVVIEIDERLAGQLPETVTEFAPDLAENLLVLNTDALAVDALPVQPTKLVANLPYNVSVPVLLHFLQKFPSIQEALVMVQAEVGERLASAPGSKIYGVPSVKAAWYGKVTKVSTIKPGVFWPAPNVDSVLVRLVRHDQLPSESNQQEVFAIVDAAFSQRRKTLRSALSGLLKSAQRSEQILLRAGINPSERGEQLELDAFIRIAQAAQEVG